MCDTTRARRFAFTLNNYTEQDCERICEIKCDYLVVGKETAPTTGTPHLQGYIEFKDAKTKSAVIKIIHPKAYVAPAIAGATMNTKYCKEDGNLLIEKGEAKTQGARTDLKKITQSIIDGETTVDDIALDKPDIYHQYARTLSKVEDLRMRKQYRTEMTQGIWYWGATGVGKSHKAYEGFTPETHYNWKYDNGWQDGYVQQETVIINEFRGQVSYSELLTLIDKWPTELRRRNREPMPFISKTVIITSALPPAEVYHNLSEKDDLAQLLRRIKVIELKRA